MVGSSLISKLFGSEPATAPTTLPAMPSGQTLRAGPITLKFQDGELRYLRVGDREIVRRIYFAVREAGFAATNMPRFTEMHIDANQDHFRIHLAASCRGKTISYNWTGDITGSADGKIVFAVSGAAPADGKSARIGLCVLYGSDSLAGQKFETLDEQGQVSPGAFPELISQKFVAVHFGTLRYSIGALHISCGIPESPFTMEDQRNYGDSSFKAFDPFPYAYPIVPRGKTFTQTLALSAQGALPTTTAPADSPIVARIGSPIPGARVVAINSPDRFSETEGFPTINQHREKFSDATAITWKWTTATHLPDDDTAMENLSAIVAQAATIRSFALRALLRVGPISLNGSWPTITRPAGLAAAWTADAIKYLCLARVDEVAFANLPPDAARIVALFKQLPGKPLVQVNVTPANDVDAFAVNDIGTTMLWLINRSDHLRTVTLENLPTSATLRASRPALSDSDIEMKSNGVELSPYDVCQVVITH